MGVGDKSRSGMEIYQVDIHGFLIPVSRSLPRTKNLSNANLLVCLVVPRYFQEALQEAIELSAHEGNSRDGR